MVKLNLQNAALMLFFDTIRCVKGWVKFISSELKK